MELAFFGKLAQERSPLLKSILAFNYDFAAEVDAGRLTALPQRLRGAALQRLLSSRRARHRLSLKLGLLTGAGGCEPCFDFADPKSRLALLGPGELRRAAHIFGICVNHGAAVQAITKQDVSEAKEALGEEGYVFAVRRAPLLAGQGLEALFLQEGTLAERLEQHGSQGLGICLENQPQALRDRLLLKLPEPWRENINNPPRLASDGAAKVWNAFRRIIAKEVSPSWAPYLS